MNSKTFQSESRDDTEIQVENNGIGVLVSILREGLARQATTLAPSDAAALMLAIGEAAYPEVQGRPNRVHYAICALLEQVEEDGFKAAEAKERAELEAEALELLLAFQAIDDPNNRGCEWHQYGTATKDKWLAVARRAREIAKETPNA